MGETQIYSQRLHGITEKRRILSEVDRIQRELEQQRVKLHQLKRKSLRDRWLMDGLVPSAGAEVQDPLSETEGSIKDLEQELESLQSELVYLENPELKALKGVTVQGVTVPKELVNGERNRQRVNHNENLKEHPISEETNQTGDSQVEKTISISQKDITSSTEKLDGHPIPKPREKNISENQHNLDSKSEDIGDKEEHSSQNVNGSVQKDADEDQKSLNEEVKIQNFGHSQELHDRKEEHRDQGENPLEPNHDGNTADEIQSIPSQLSSMENTSEQKDQILISPANESESVHQQADESLSISDFNNDLFNHNQDGKESLLDEITKLVNLGEQKAANQENQDGNKLSISNDELNPQATFTHGTEDGLNLEKHKVLTGHGTLDEEHVLHLETERAHLESLDGQEETKELVTVFLETEEPVINQGSILLQKDQTPGSSPTSIQNSVLPPGNQEADTTLPCTDQDPSQLLPSPGQNQVDQVQISQILVVPAPGYEQSSSISLDPTASRQPMTKENNTAPESQPLLQKPQETDGQQGANTAETRDKSKPTKKKTCQCCVVM